MMAISLGIYEKTIKIISNIFHINYKDFIFLVTISIGIISGIILFSNVIIYFLKNYYFQTMCLFIGLIVNGFYQLKKEITFNKKNIILIIIITTLLINLICYLNNHKLLTMTKNELTYFFLGCTEVITSIIPGISGTAIYMSLGIYETLLEIFTNLLNKEYMKENFFFSLGIIISIIIISKIISFIFERNKFLINIIIFAFMTSSLLMMINKLLLLKPKIIEIIIGIFFYILGYKLTNVINKK